MNQSVTFYYQPNNQRKSEAAFVHALTGCYPDSQSVNEHFFVPQSTVDQFVDTDQFLHWLQTDTLLAPKKRLACIEILQSCPSKSLRVALHPKKISFDVVAKIGDEVYYWEYHEKQHANLSVDRPKCVYTPEGNPIIVPRYFQRLLRDIWRAIYFRPYTVVWQNWFESSGNEDESLELKDGYREFHLDGKFSFENFLSENCHSTEK